ncbi:TIM barrel protein [Xanthobacter sp. KR7-225]|uniref:sugar phosphate isomerase/epimerase family protein n=1 Tax=Xanthobacter sp. KR7-225 TaxID=3156613 RepID=UPI0032B626E0
MRHIETVMWTGTVRSLSLQDQLKVSKGVGCRALSISPHLYTKWLSDGLSTREMRNMAEDSGVRIFHLDPYARWMRQWRANNLDQRKYPIGFRGFAEDDFFRIGEALGVESVSAIVSCDAAQVSWDELYEGFARTCDRAADAGMRVDLEFIPFWGLPDLASAWNVLKTVGRPNSGLVFDCWHYFRGRPDDALLSSIPGERISSVQLADAELEVVHGDNLVDDCLSFRRPPGDGNFPLAALLRLLYAIGGLNRVGPEIFSAALDGRGSDEIASVCRSSLGALFHAAHIDNPFATD